MGVRGGKEEGGKKKGKYIPNNPDHQKAREP